MARLGWGGLMAVLLSGGSAHAGARPYAFTAGIDTLPPLELEVENWFTADNPRGAERASWDWWIGPVAGITDSIEVALFPIFVQAAGTGGAPAGGLQFSELRGQISWLLADKGQWPIDIRLRAEYGQPVLDGNRYTLWLHVIASRDFGRFNLSLDPSMWLAYGKEDPAAAKNEAEIYVEYGAGASYDISHGLRLGAESFGSFTERHHYVGPAFAWGVGRVWGSIAVGAGIGDDSSTARGRLVVGFVL